MTINEAAEILRQHNVCRRWEGDPFEEPGPPRPSASDVGEAIDVLVAYVLEGAR